jgi:4'-phosphopantetheinyl transferase
MDGRTIEALVSSMEESRLAPWSFGLTEEMVHVWSLRTTEVSNAVVSKFEIFLTPDERGRAERFRFENLRHSFVLTRGALRVLLGRYLHIPPAKIQIAYGSKGKPRLAEPELATFNVSHSGGLAVFGFAASSEIGVDVEEVRPMADMLDIAQRFFCPGEAADLISLPANQRERGFFRCWTRKEAYIKALGEGLSVPLDGFQVTLRPGEPAKIIHLARDANAARTWRLCDLELSSGYVGALAYHGLKRQLHLLQPINAAELLDIA